VADEPLIEPPPEPAVSDPAADAPLPDGALPLDDTTVRVRQGGVNVRAEPTTASAKLGGLMEGAQRKADALIFKDYTWLRTPWPHGAGDNTGWIAAEFTDFPRSRHYNQVVEAWYESEAVLAFRRALLRDVMQTRGVSAEMIADVGDLSGERLRQLEETVHAPAIPAGYTTFWNMREHIGLPAPFDYLPVHPSPPAKIEAMEFNGFGPNTFAYNNWEIYYENTRGLHNGVDFIVDEGSPLIAVADGVIVDFRFLGSSAEQSLALRPYLPETFRKPDGSRVLSNVIVAYGHLTGSPTTQIVRVGSTVQAGQIIGTSGWPIYTRDDGGIGIQYNNAHLHLEVHLVTDGQHAFHSRQPFNPLLFWSPRLVAFQARLAAHRDSPPYPSGGQPWGRLGFFSLGCFRYEPRTIVWRHTPTTDAIWPPGVYDLDGMNELLAGFAPYPLDGSGAA